jgi:hypothetical protein
MNCGGQGVQAKANKILQKENCKLALFLKKQKHMYHIAGLYTTVNQQKSARIINFFPADKFYFRLQI